MKDFTFWRGALYNAKTIVELKSIGEDLAQFQKQSGLFRDDEKKLTDDQVAALRKQYSEKVKKLESEALPGRPPGKPEFKK
jgi:hypothetical protein